MRMQQLGIRDFLHNTFFKNIMEIWSIQDRISKSRLVYFVFQSLFINFLDFFGIILTGVVGSLSISILSGKDVPLFLVVFFCLLLVLVDIHMSTFCHFQNLSKMYSFLKIFFNVSGR